MSSNKEYEVGDRVKYETFIPGDIRIVLVTNKEEDIKNGLPGFDGETSDGLTVWGYDYQIISVIPRD